MDIVAERKMTAILFILCFVVFAVGSILFLGREIWRWPAAQTATYLLWERSAIIAALLINVMGFVLLERLLNAAGDAVIGRLALVIYLLGAAVLVVAETTFLSNRQSVYPQIVTHVVLAFLVQAAFGVALLRTGLVAGWAGWATIIWNLAWLVLLPIITPRDMYFPVLHHFAPLLIGIALLAKG